MSQPLIDLQHISKSFDGELVLDDLNLSIRENSFVTLLGPSGCGKTTTLRILGGFITQDTGKVMFEGQDITRIPPTNASLTPCSRNMHCFPISNIAENIAFGLKIKNKSKSYIDDKIKYALKAGQSVRLRKTYRGFPVRRTAAAHSHCKGHCERAKGAFIG